MQKIPVSVQEEFTGRFTPELRQQFHRKRLSLGLSMQQLGACMKLNWSTIRKWECGKTSVCHPRHILLVQKFLAGDFDDCFCTAPNELDELAACWHKLPASMHNCLERIAMIYELCTGDPELQGQLLTQLNAAANEAVMDLAALGSSSHPLAGFPKMLE